MLCYQKLALGVTAENGEALDVKPGACTLNCHRPFRPLISVTLNLVESSEYTRRINRSKIHNRTILRKYIDQINIQQ